MRNMGKGFVQLLADAKTYDAVFFHEILITCKKIWFLMIAQIMPDSNLLETAARVLETLP